MPRRVGARSRLPTEVPPMLLHGPASLEGLLSLLAPCFPQPTFQTFRALVVGQVSQTGLRTVCGMLVGARLSQVWDHCRAHRLRTRPGSRTSSRGGLIRHGGRLRGSPRRSASTSPSSQPAPRSCSGRSGERNRTARSAIRRGGDPRASVRRGLAALGAAMRELPGSDAPAEAHVAWRASGGPTGRCSATLRSGG